VVPEAYLGTTNGGFGINPTTLGDNTVVSINNTSNIAALPYATASTASTLAQRDASGGITISQLNLTNPTAGQSIIYTGTCSTAAAATETNSIVSIPTASNTSYFVVGNVVVSDSSGQTSTFSFQFAAANAAGTITLSSTTPANLYTILYPTNSPISISLSQAAASGSNPPYAQVIANPASNANALNWYGTFIVSQIPFAT